ncbi:2-methylfumaryl-CoA hydratase [Halorubellus sp. PRR65]|uniref:2-methylfumaryl-CoA hydratase n=1 Tax=Halorubellus sp. PRR65 TaxID=3098148 RepID=UPI002B25C5D2|nr:2-methylfumaryl-CoA hydratase [Halorubellus sp. PRR65]
MTGDFELSDGETFRAALDRAATKAKGNCFEDFADGDELEHDPGLTLTRHASETWAGQTLNHDPAYWRPDAARDRGFDSVPAHPDYVTAAVMGPTVEDLSEKGGYFLGRTNLRFHADAVDLGTTLQVRSEVLDTATSSSRPNYGIVTWRTEGVDADTGDRLLSYERTNMIPRRNPPAADGGEHESVDEPPETDDRDLGLPGTFVEPDGGHFEDFAAALATTEDTHGGDAAVAYRHERGRTMDAVTVSQLPLMTLNTAKQHHDANVMADSPSGDLVAYGDVTRSTALGNARSDEATWREVGFDDERFHTFVTPGDTVYCFTHVRDARDEDADERYGTVEFEHVAFNQDDDPVYSGTRTARIQRRSTTNAGN